MRPVSLFPFPFSRFIAPMSLPNVGRLLGLDWGEVRIGLALSDETQTLATPLETLVRRRGKRFPMARFLELVGEHQPAGVVVGLPLTGEGDEEESGEEEQTKTNTHYNSLLATSWFTEHHASAERYLQVTAAMYHAGFSARPRRGDPL